MPNKASSGRTSVTRPPATVNPLGLFIHAFTAITISEPVKPATTTGMPERKWARGERRSQP